MVSERLFAVQRKSSVIVDSMTHVTRALSAIEQGDPHTATALVHDAFLRLVNKDEARRGPNNLVCNGPRGRQIADNAALSTFWPPWPRLS